MIFLTMTMKFLFRVLKKSFICSDYFFSGSENTLCEKTNLFNSLFDRYI